MIDLETALAALELESESDLEKIDVQEIPLAFKESRQLGEWHQWNDCSATCDGLRHSSHHDSAHGNFCTGVADEVQNCASSSGCEEKNLCDEARDYWENREERWVRVHSIARRTLFDPMHDEQPFCPSLTERRRTTVRFLEQQSEMMIDDTWPQAGEMRSLWKATTEFWTNDMPQDDTWEANRHHRSFAVI